MTLKPLHNTKEEQINWTVAPSSRERSHSETDKTLWHMKTRLALSELRHIPRNPKENWKAAQPSAEALRSAFAFVEKDQLILLKNRFVGQLRKGLVMM